MPILLALSKAIEARDPYSAGHAARVTSLADVLACRLGWHAEQREVLRLGGSLHDIGKLVVPQAVLQKPGPLTEAEQAEVRKHPEAGAAIVWPVASLRAAVPGVLCHHERWDGGGYPNGLARDGIPAEARVLAVADSFDAMTTDRPYREALPDEIAIEELERGAGTQFDAEIAQAFVDAWESGAFCVAAALGAAAS
jgi:HD-GYP domain-containing protein (c-di-GMP phosphodiesterase class II)